MPWVDRGVINCPAGVNTTLIQVTRANFLAAFQTTDFPIGTVRYLGVLRYAQGLPGVVPSVDTEIEVRRYWYNAVQWRLTNTAAGGRISFYSKESNDFLLVMRVWEFVP